MLYASRASAKDITCEMQAIAQKCHVYDHIIMIGGGNWCSKRDGDL